MEQFQWMFRLYDSMSGPAKTITGSLGNVEKALKGLPEAAAMAQDGFKRLIDGALEVGRIAIEGGKFALEALSFKESTLESFKLMLGTKEAAIDFFNTAKGFGRLTPFETEDVVKGFQQLKSAGFSKQEVPIVFQAVGDVAAASGFDKQVMDRLAYAFGQIKNGGAHMLTHALREVVINGSRAGLSTDKIYTNMGKILGVDSKTAQEMAHKGRITADVAMAAILDTIKATASGGKDLGQGMLNQATTIKGLLSTIKSAPMDLFLDMDLDKLQGFQGVKKFLQGLADTLNPASDAGQRLRVQLEHIVDAVGGWLGSFSLEDMVGAFNELISVVRTTMSGFDAFKNGMTAVLEPTFELLAGLDGGAGSARGFALAMGVVGMAIGGLVNVLILLSVALFRVLEAFDSLQDFSIVEFFKNWDPLGIGDLQKRWSDFGINLMLGLAEGIKSAAMYPVNAVKEAASQAIGAFTSVMGIHSPSTVFARFGEYTTQGYAQGIENGGGNVDKAITSMVAAPAVRGGRGGGGNTFNVEVHVDGAGSDAETIARRLAEILPSQLASAFEQMAIEDGVA